MIGCFSRKNLWRSRGCYGTAEWSITKRRVGRRARSTGVRVAPLGRLCHQCQSANGCTRTDAKTFQPIRVWYVPTRDQVQCHKTKRPKKIPLLFALLTLSFLSSFSLYFFFSLSLSLSYLLSLSGLKSWVGWWIIQKSKC